MSTALHALRTTSLKNRHEAPPKPPSPSARAGASSGGQALDETSRHTMTARFGHDFSHVRIHSDSRAGDAAQGLGAKAYTVGSDIVFNDGFYDPHGWDGRRLLAHELTHVVQRDRHGGAADGLSTVSDPGDASEREAEAVGERAVAGGRVQVQAAPPAVASRGVLDWVEDQVSDTLSGAWDGAKAVGSEVADEASDYASNAYTGMKMAAGGIREGEEYANEGIDWLEDEEKEGTSWLVDHLKGDPQMEEWAKEGKTVLDNGTELVGGVGRGATGLVGGVAQAVVDPVDTVKGLGAMAQHVPFIGAPFQQPHDLEEDGRFWSGLGDSMLNPYRKQWAEGKYADVVGHAGFDVGSLIFGAGDVAKGMKVAEAAADTGKVGDAANLARDAAKAGEVSKAGDAADLGRAGEAKVSGGGGAQPPGGVPPSGGGAGGGRGPQSIEEMIAQEMAREHAGAHPLDPTDFAGGSRPVAPPTPAPSRSVPAPNVPMDPIPPGGSRGKAPVSEYDTMIQTMKNAGMSAEEAEKVARELAGTPEVKGGSAGQISPAKKAEMVRHMTTRRYPSK